MGVCSSCLGGRSKPARHAEPSETTRLLNSANSQYDGAGEISYLEFGRRAEPERERQERESFIAIQKLTADHLIDVTQTSVPGEHASTTDQEFATLFRNAFSRHRPHGSHGGQQRDQDAESDEEAEPVDEQEWLRNIILRDPQDTSWDCNTVTRIGRPLIINFDDS